MKGLPECMQASHITYIHEQKPSSCALERTIDRLRGSGLDLPLAPVTSATFLSLPMLMSLSARLIASMEGQCRCARLYIESFVVI